MACFGSAPFPRSTPRWLRACTLAGLAALSCYNRKDYNNPTEPAKGFLTLAVTNEVPCSPPPGANACLPADGLSRLLLTATVNANSTTRVIDFTTTAGTFSGAAPPGNSIKATISTGGTATVELQSASVSENATVQAQVDGQPEASATVVVAFLQPGPNSILQSLTAPASEPADGATAAPIILQLAPDVPAGSRSITLVTTAGSFVQGGSVTTATVNADTTGHASTLLYSPTEVGQAVVTATVLNNSRQVSIVFTRALPDSILLQLSGASVTDSASSSLTFTAQLIRNIGTVTAGTEVDFAVHDAKGRPFGVFTGFTPSNGSGVATAVFSPAGQGHIGTATVTATVPQSSASATATFEVVTPPTGV